LNRPGLLLCAAALAVLAACSSTPPASPDAARVEAREGHRFAEQNRLDEAKAAYDRALSLDPQQPEALRDRAILLHAAGRQAEALVDIRAAAALRPDDMRTIGALCVIRVANERTDAGLADCQRASTLAGSPANAAVSLGQALLLLGRPVDALAAFDQALAAAPNHMRALYGRGQARLAAGDVQGEADVQAALGRLPGAGREFFIAKGA